MMKIRSAIRAREPLGTTDSGKLKWLITGSVILNVAMIVPLIYLMIEFQKLKTAYRATLVSSNNTAIASGQVKPTTRVDYNLSDINSRFDEIDWKLQLLLNDTGKSA